jgi:exosortase A-associated hydrolase 2
MDEVPLFFPGGGDYALFGVLHRPAAVEGARPAFVFCHPLAEEKLWAHRVFVSYARQLAAAGYPVLRFDLTGNGDSEGQFSDLSMELACADVRAAIAEVRRLTEVSAVSLLGLRMGATVAGIVAEGTEDIRQLIQWAPITDGERYMQELLRINVMTQMAVYKEVRQERPALVGEMQQGRTVNVDGYEMGWPLYSSVSAIKLGSEPRAFGGPCLIVQIDKQTRPAGELQRLAASYPSATLRFAQEEPFWKEIARFYQEAPNLFGVTNTWLGGR